MHSAYCILGVDVIYYWCQEGKAPDELSRPRWDTKPKSRCVATMPILCRKPPVEKKLRFFSTTLWTNHSRCDTIRVPIRDGHLKLVRLLCAERSERMWVRIPSIPPKRTWKKFLTNPLKYDTIRVQKARARRPEEAEGSCTFWRGSSQVSSRKNIRLGKKVLTNHLKCDIIKIQKERETSSSGDAMTAP